MYTQLDAKAVTVTREPPGPGAPAPGVRAATGASMCLDESRGQIFTTARLTVTLTSLEVYPVSLPFAFGAAVAQWTIVQQ